MAQLGNLIVNGSVKSIGKITAPEFVGSLTGTAVKATQDGDGKQISTTYAKLETDNNFISHANEFNFVSSKASTSGGDSRGVIYINYRLTDKSADSSSTITDYRFCNGQANTLSKISAASFNGYTINSSVPSGAKFTDTVYSLPDATASVKGGVKIGSNITVSSGTISLTKANVTSALGYTPPTSNTTYSNMKGATTSAAGTNGLVPAPAVGAANRYLRSDGTWVVPPDTNTTYTSLKNPNPITISLNGSSQGSYDGSTAKSINITPASIGASPSSHTHTHLITLNGAISALSNQSDGWYKWSGTIDDVQGTWILQKMSTLYTATNIEDPRVVLNSNNLTKWYSPYAYWHA